MSDIKQAVREQVISEFMDGQGDKLTDETRLVEEEIIDSLGIFLMLGFIKERFGIEVDPEDVTLDNFASVNTIVDLINGKRDAA